MGALRYLLFIAVGLVVASVLFVALNFIVSANFEAGVGRRALDREGDLRSVRADG